MRFVFIGLLTVLTVAQSSASQSLSARADSVVKAAEKNGFSGVVRVEKAGVVVLEKGYGLAIRNPAVRFTPATVVQIGSNTKDFTAVAILQLQERGKLKIQDTLGKFFPSAPADKRGITVYQLMKHRAGYPLGLGGDFEAISRQQLIDSAMKFKLLFKPGEKQSYSNTGYSLLAAVVEKLSGKSYDVYVRDNILAPLQSEVQSERTRARISTRRNRRRQHHKQATCCRRTVLESSRKWRNGIDSRRHAYVLQSVVRN